MKNARTQKQKQKNEAKQSEGDNQNGQKAAVNAKLENILFFLAQKNTILAIAAVLITERRKQITKTSSIYDFLMIKKI